MLIPSEPGDTDTDGSCIWDGIVELKIQYFAESAKQFINGPAKILFSPQSEDDIDSRFTSLRDILQAAGDLSIQLRKQKVGISCLYIDSSQLIQKGFQPNSGLMEPHDGMCLEDGNHTLDGEEIVMVVEPAIVAYWTGDGEEKKGKIWAKSVVWINGWDRVEVEKEFQPLTTDRDCVQPALEQLSAPTTITIPNTDNDNNQMLKDPADAIRSSVGTTEFRFTSDDRFSPSNIPEAVPHSMGILTTGDNSNPLTQRTGVDRISLSLSSLPPNPETTQLPMTEQTNTTLKKEAVCNSAVENGKSFQQILACGPNSLDETIRESEATSIGYDKNTPSKHDEKVPPRSHSSPQISVVINSQTTHVSRPQSEPLAETRIGDATRGSSVSRIEDIQCPVKDTKFGEPKLGAITQEFPHLRNGHSIDNPEPYGINPASATTEQQDDDAHERSIEAVTGEPLTVEVKMENDDAAGLSLSQGNTINFEVPATPESSDEATQKMKVQTEAVILAAEDTQTFMGDKACNIV
jgi:hypothetical protein